MENGKKKCFLFQENHEILVHNTDNHDNNH